MARYGMVVDVAKCNGCYNCFLTCKDEYCGNDHPPYSSSQPMTGHQWMRIIETERGTYPKVKVSYTPTPCMHCQKPPCVEAGKGDAVYRRDDGIVLIDPLKASGQKNLIFSCPYGAIYWNEETGIPQKCTLCAHLLDGGWKEPRCVEACPTGALVFGDLDDPDSAVARLVASGETEALEPARGLAERVLYIGLPKRFIAGAVVLGDTDECAVGASVILEAGGEKMTAPTDGFGDFEFEGLLPDETYRVTVSAPGYEGREFVVTTTADVYLGDVVLSRTPT